MILDNYDDFNFMVILLFLYFILVAFIIMIISNLKYKSKYNKQQETSQSNQYPQTTTMPQCNPNKTDEQCYSF